MIETFALPPTASELQSEGLVDAAQLDEGAERLVWLDFYA